MNAAAVTDERCAHLCHECQDACLHMMVHCLNLGGEHASRGHQMAMADCAEICALLHNFLHRMSPHAVHLCRECAEICTKCAESCERLGGTDDAHRRCIEACRKCAEACTQMAGVMAR